MSKIKRVIIDKDEFMKLHENQSEETKRKILKILEEETKKDDIISENKDG